MPLAETRGALLRYELHGDGPPLVFVHAATGSRLSWWQQVAHFRSRFTCLVFDQRGFGDSVAREEGPIAGSAFADDMWDLIEQRFPDQPVTLVATAWGTHGALEMALTHPAAVENLILSNGCGNLAEDAPAATRQAAAPSVTPPDAAGRELARFAMLLGERGPFGADAAMQRPDLAFLFAQLSIAFERPEPASLLPARVATTQDLAGLRCPTLLLTGGKDPHLTPQRVIAAAGRFEKARVEVVADAGHSAFFSHAGEFNACLDRFLIERVSNP